MPTITKPYGDFVNNLDVADATKVNAQMNTIYNAVNGQLDLTNLAAAAYSQSKAANKLVEWDANSMVQAFLNVLSGGYKVQSGSGTIAVTANTQATATVTFPIAFSAAPIVVAGLSAGQGNNIWQWVVAGSPSATQFTLAAEANATTTVYWAWIAIGS